MKEKREMLLKRLNVLIEGREREFLLFMEEVDGSISKERTNEELDVLLDSFIYFEEDNSEEEFTEETMEEVLNIYIPGFEKGEHVF
jgi:tRNA nucleotidyltransferase (CCA-adding enzyme)